MIYIHCGTRLQEMTARLMEAAKISEKLQPDMHVVIKPNLVVSRSASGGATTHPEIVEGIVRYLKDFGVARITIAEGAWVGDSTKRAFDNCGYRDLANRYGVLLFDTKNDQTIVKASHGFEIPLCESIVTADYLINAPVLKGHCQTRLTCCLKNLKGCIPDSEKRRFHTLGLHKPIAALATAIRPDLHIVDNVCGDLDFEEGGNPIESNRILLGFDPVLLDSYAARWMGYQPKQIEHLRLARDWGVGRFVDETTKIREFGVENRPKNGKLRSATATQLTKYIDEDGACSACYAALIFALNRMDLRRFTKNRIKIGQGFKGKTCPGIGVGNCTAGCERSLKGCPPKGLDIVNFLNQQ